MIMIVFDKKKSLTQRACRLKIFSRYILCGGIRYKVSKILAQFIRVNENIKLGLRYVLIECINSRNLESILLQNVREYSEEIRGFTFGSHIDMQCYVN